MTTEEKQQKREQLKFLFYDKGIRATKIAKDLNINRATVHVACSPNIDRPISKDKLELIYNYLKSK